MIAYAAQRLGLDPTYLIGGEVPQLGGNAGPGGGTLLVAEADESDGTLSLLRPRIAVVTNLELDHHAAVRLAGGAAELFAEWTATLPAGGRADRRHESVDAADRRRRCTGSAYGDGASGR